MMFANAYKDRTGFDYIIGDPYKEMSICAFRHKHIAELNDISMQDFKESIKLTFRDPISNAWSKKGWQQYYDIDHDNFMVAYDVHRSILRNEILVESDYMCPDCTALKKLKLPTTKGCDDCYGLNYKATQIIGSILESKGFIPMYYYSGNKGVHIHILLDFKVFLEIDMFLQKEILEKYKYKKMFVKKFIEWLREKIINCWDLKYKDFDTGMIRSTHLIRTEMSKNKAGYKTFLGYSYKDVSFIPYICNEENRIYPQIGEIKLSRPNNPQELIEEFMMWEKTKKIKAKIDKKSASLSKWVVGDVEKEMSKYAKFILSNKFKEAGDGFKRGMFILANELKKEYDEAQVIILLKDWNERMDSPIEDKEMEYRVFKLKEYTLTDKYQKDFLASLGFKDI